MIQLLRKDGHEEKRSVEEILRDLVERCPLRRHTGVYNNRLSNTLTWPRPTAAGVPPPRLSVV